MLELLMKAMLLGEPEVPDSNADSLQEALEEHKHPSQVFGEAENVGLRAQILTLQKALVDFAKERELLANEMRRLREEISKFEEENTRLWHENERFRSENRNLKGTLQQQDEEIAELQARISGLYTKLETTHSEVDDDEAADESSVSAGDETGGDEEVSSAETGESPEAESDADSVNKTDDSEPAGAKEEWVGY